MRQQFAIKMIDLLVNRKRIIAIDETWLGETNFERRSWQRSQGQESQILNVFQPRITMIAAIDTFGDAYLSLL